MKSRLTYVESLRIVLPTYCRTKSLFLITGHFYHTYREGLSTCTTTYIAAIIPGSTEPGIFFALQGGDERYGCSLKPCEGEVVHPVSASYDTLTVQYKTLRVLRLRDLTCTLLRRGKKYGI